MTERLLLRPDAARPRRATPADDRPASATPTAPVRSATPPAPTTPIPATSRVRADPPTRIDRRAASDARVRADTPAEPPGERADALARTSPERVMTDALGIVLLVLTLAVLLLIGG